MQKQLAGDRQNKGRLDEMTERTREEEDETVSLESQFSENLEGAQAKFEKQVQELKGIINNQSVWAKMTETFITLAAPRKQGKKPSKYISVYRITEGSLR